MFRRYEAERLAILAVSGSAPSNFVAVEPPGAENRVQRAGDPGDVGQLLSPVEGTPAYVLHLYPALRRKCHPKPSPNLISNCMMI